MTLRIKSILTKYKINSEELIKQYRDGILHKCNCSLFIPDADINQDFEDAYKQCPRIQDYQKCVALMFICLQGTKYENSFKERIKECGLDCAIMSQYLYLLVKQSNSLMSTE